MLVLVSRKNPPVSIVVLANMESTMRVPMRNRGVPNATEVIFWARLAPLEKQARQVALLAHWVSFKT